ncbi:MAG: alkaline phosphatase, partial [Hyphomonadaceae bacterium]
DENFARVARRGTLTARPANDYCVKVDARGLQPGRTYFYRFLGAAGPSVTGVTRTAPATGDVPLRFAMFSCANIAFGYFHAYGHAAQRADIDIALHLGDYFYEYPPNVYPGRELSIAERVPEPRTETVTNAHYNQRLGSYHLDPDLQELRRLKPLSVVWDDHEIANNTYRDGAQNHQPAEGSWADRVAGAHKAYFDWMPIRSNDRAHARIYRTIDWGSTARIILLDTRFIGRQRELEYDAIVAAAAQGPAAALAAVSEFRTQLEDPSRTMMGATQERWLNQQLAGSKRRGQAWQVLAQQVVMGRQLAPQGISRLLPADVSAGTRRYVSGGEQLGALGLPLNLDAWDGYPAARQRVLDACVRDGTNALVIGGDSHHCWVNNLEAAGGGRMAAVEFAGGSVSSGGFETALTNAQPGERESMMRSGNPNMAWCDVSHRGYGAITLTRDACEAEWVAFPSVRERERPEPTITRLTSRASEANGPSAWQVPA